MEAIEKIFIQLKDIVLSSYTLSFLATAISLFTLWDNKFRFKFDVTAGKQAKLWVASLDKGKIRPAIFFSFAFTNSGGKTGYVNDIKLLVKIISDNRCFLETEFESLREYDSLLLSDASKILQTEILPIVIVGKTTQVKKYIFFPTKHIEQSQIPKSFDLCIKVMTKHGTVWRSQKEYEIKNTDNVWQDLNETANWRFNTKDVFNTKNKWDL